MTSIRKSTLICSFFKLFYTNLSEIYLDDGIGTIEPAVLTLHDKKV